MPIASRKLASGWRLQRERTPSGCVFALGRHPLIGLGSVCHRHTESGSPFAAKPSECLHSSGKRANFRPIGRNSGVTDAQACPFAFGDASPSISPVGSEPPPKKATAPIGCCPFFTIYYIQSASLTHAMPPVFPPPRAVAHREARGTRRGRPRGSARAKCGAPRP